MWAMNCVRTTDSGRIARGKWSARTRLVLLTIDVEPEVTDAEMTPKMMTPTDRKPILFPVPFVVPMMTPKIR